MGISYRGVIVVGYTYDQAHKLYELDEQAHDFGDWADSEGLERCGPYYDADSDDCIYCVVVANTNSYSVEELDGDLPERIGTTQVELTQKYSEQPGVYLMAEGS